MSRLSRCLVAGAAGVALLLGPVPAFAADPGDAAGAPTPVPVPTADLDLEQLPVEATDVTSSDTDLRATSAEVTVLTETADGTPTITKLRTDSAADARDLVAHLDAEPGVVATRTHRLRASAVNREPLAAQQWNLRMIGAPAAWDVTQGGGVKVAVIDSGVDATHPDLRGRVAAEIDLLPEVTPTPAQTQHGTRVASLIAAARNGVGMAGVAPAATILPVAALDETGVGDTSTVARGVIAAANAGAKVINLSLGGPDADPVLERACAYARAKGAVVVAAGGNSFDDGNLPQYPAAYPSVIAVAAVDSGGYPALFSNTGRYIDLAAPGEAVLSAVPGGGYGRQSGTSFSAPQVAGAAALVSATNPRLSATRITQLTVLTAQDDRSGDGADIDLGYGVLRADRAVAAARALKLRPQLATARARIVTLNATPEPLRKGRAATVTARIQTRHLDGAWRTTAMPYVVRFEFKAKGSTQYKPVAVTNAPNGQARIKSVPKSSGRWRAKVLQADGTWSKSKTDYVRMRG